MTLRHTFSALLALAALLGAGCGRGDNLAYSAEADDPLYQQGQAFVEGQTQTVGLLVLLLQGVGEALKLEGAQLGDGGVVEHGGQSWVVCRQRRQ